MRQSPSDVLIGKGLNLRFVTTKPRSFVDRYGKWMIIGVGVKPDAPWPVGPALTQTFVEQIRTHAASLGRGDEAKMRQFDIGLSETFELANADSRAAFS